MSLSEIELIPAEVFFETVERAQKSQERARLGESLLAVQKMLREDMIEYLGSDTLGDTEALTLTARSDFLPTMMTLEEILDYVTSGIQQWLQNAHYLADINIFIGIDHYTVRIKNLQMSQTSSSTKVCVTDRG